MSEWRQAPIGTEPPLQAPGTQTMNADPVDLAQCHGIFVRQKTQVQDTGYLLFGVPYVAQNRYRMFRLPSNVPNPSWVPTAGEVAGYDEIMFIDEESDLLDRAAWAFLGGAQLRPLILHVGSTQTGKELFQAHRPFQIGGHCCCPWEMDILSPDNSVIIGRVVQNFDPYCDKCCQQCWTMTNYTDVIPSVAGQEPQAKFTLKRSSCCCGRVNNCCGATCCNPKEVIDILDDRGKLIGVIERHYAAGDKACFRMCFGFINFSLRFPPQTSREERMLLLSAMMLQEYTLTPTA